MVGVGIGPVSIMYAFDPAHWGQGYASECVPAFVKHVQERLDVEEIFADCFTDNPASASVLLKAGFVETGPGRGWSKARGCHDPTREFRLTRAASVATTASL